MHNILLMEPGYRNKYPPLGLMKLASYHRAKSDYVKFSKGLDAKLLNTRWDRIYVTTLFSFEFKRTAEQIDFAIKCANNQHHRVFVGGIAASLMTEEFLTEPRWYGVRFIQGLLDNSPAESLQLNQFAGDFYADDLHGKPIEDHIPDYSILEHIRHYYKYPVYDAYFGYASRGCIRKCHFCGVPKLEGMQRDSMSISKLVNGVRQRYGEKKDLILMDNNVTASSNFRNIIAEIRSLGFEKDATLKRNGRAVKRRVDFNQGVDARILVKDKIYLQEMSTICISPLRIAFDHLGLRRHYVQSVRYANEFGIKQLSNYMLYNFYEPPSDLYERLRINIKLNQELGISIWSFPMRYQPVTLKDRSHIGRKWIWYWLRSFQIILQATHGVVSGNPSYFRHAFGESAHEFKQLLILPHHMIFHREYYEHFGGKSEREEFEKLYDRLSEFQKKELIELLSKLKSSSRFHIDQLIEFTNDSNLKQILQFYRPPLKNVRNSVEKTVHRIQLDQIKSVDGEKLTKEQWVEDAGLFKDKPVAISEKNRQVASQHRYSQ